MVPFFFLWTATMEGEVRITAEETDTQSVKGTHSVHPEAVTIN